ncbi:hypothetical protein GE09DRAFT_333719 [Coniochaeta sp. 2T2.1]|nr:hypothetical protein GE09DRAFT_333719 [Coniochaeta sp. 2T2.1]
MSNHSQEDGGSLEDSYPTARTTLPKKDAYLSKYITDHRQLPKADQIYHSQDGHQKTEKPKLRIRAITTPFIDPSQALTLASPYIDFTMGGSAFARDPYSLDTPRMPPAVYHNLKSACHARLREMYLYVASPIDGPGKQDHGDIDIIVFLEKQSIFPSSPQVQLPHPRTGHEPLQQILEALGAQHAIYQQPMFASANFAIPWPEDDGFMAEFDSSATVQKPRHVQVDVKIACSLEEFHFSLFRHSHGDFSQIVGTSIRPLGLTIDEKALYIRIPEIENSDRKRAKVELTADPVEILQFLGLRGDRTDSEHPPGEGPVDGGAIPDDDTGSFTSSGIWERPFDSAQEMFHYIASSRYFWVSAPKQADNPFDMGDQSSMGNNNQPSAVDLSSLRSNDRRRMNQRRVYQRWMKEYIPSLYPSVRDGTFPNTEFNNLSTEAKRDLVRTDAFVHWPSARAEYQQVLARWRTDETIRKQKSDIQMFIHDACLEHTQDELWRRCAVGALKKIIIKGESILGVAAPGLMNANGTYDMWQVDLYLDEHGVAIGKKAWEAQAANYKAHLEDKARQQQKATEQKEATEQAGPAGEQTTQTTQTLGESMQKAVETLDEANQQALVWALELAKQPSEAKKLTKQALEHAK